MMEDAILTLAQAIEALAEAITRDKRIPAPITIEKTTEYVKGVGWPVTKITEAAVMTMDDAGTPTQFKYRCGICGEEGRNRQSCQDEMIDGTYHWIKEVV